MGERPLREEEKDQLRGAIARVKATIRQYEVYLADLEDRLEKGTAWTLGDEGHRRASARVDEEVRHLIRLGILKEEDIPRRPRENK